MAVDMDIAYIRRNGRFRISYWDVFSIGVANICIACVLVALILLTNNLPAPVKILGYILGIVSLFGLNMLLLKSLLENVSFLHFHNGKTVFENKQSAKNILEQLDLTVFESANDILFSYYAQTIGRRKLVKDIYVLTLHGCVMLNIRNHNEFNLSGSKDPSAKNIIASFENIFGK